MNKEKHAAAVGRCLLLRQTAVTKGLLLQQPLDWPHPSTVPHCWLGPVGSQGWPFCQAETPLQEIFALELPLGLAGCPWSHATAWGSPYPIPLSPTSPFTGVRPAPWSEGAPLVLAGVIPNKPPALLLPFSHLFSRTKVNAATIRSQRPPLPGLGELSLSPGVQSQAGSVSGFSYPLPFASAEENTLEKKTE